MGKKCLLHGRFWMEKYGRAPGLYPLVPEVLYGRQHHLHPLFLAVRFGVKQHLTA